MKTTKGFNPWKKEMTQWTLLKLISYALQRHCQENIKTGHGKGAVGYLQTCVSDERLNKSNQTPNNQAKTWAKAFNRHITKKDT